MIVWPCINLATFFYVTTQLDIKRDLLSFFVYLTTTTTFIALFVGTGYALLLPPAASAPLVFSDLKNKFLLRHLFFYLPVVIGAVGFFSFQFYYWCRYGTLYNIFSRQKTIAVWLNTKKYSILEKLCEARVVNMSSKGLHQNVFVFKHFLYFFGIPLLNLVILYAFVAYNVPFRAFAIMVICNLCAFCYRQFFSYFSLHVDTRVKELTEKYEVVHTIVGFIDLPKLVHLSLFNLRLRCKDPFDMSLERSPERELETRQIFRNYYVFQRTYLHPLRVIITVLGIVLLICRAILVIMLYFLWRA